MTEVPDPVGPPEHMAPRAPGGTALERGLRQPQAHAAPSHHAQAQHEPQYRFAVEALTVRFEGMCSGDEVLAAVEQARQEIEPGATVHDFLELLVERRARAILSAGPRQSTEGPMLPEDRPLTAAPPVRPDGH
ncbi:MAG: hypothetical protein WBL35_11220 [Ornithinibacter sp.]